MTRLENLRKEANERGYILINYALYVGDKAKYKLLYPQNRAVAGSFNKLEEVKRFLEENKNDYTRFI
jgi:hypothetical protein